MAYFSQVSVAPSRRTMGPMKERPRTITAAPKAMAEKKATEKTLLARSSFRAPSRREI